MPWTVLVVVVAGILSGVVGIVYAIVFQWYDVSAWEGITSIAVSAVILYLLFSTPRTKAYYASG